jgi:hypothetical protein
MIHSTIRGRQFQGSKAFKPSHATTVAQKSKSSERRAAGQTRPPHISNLKRALSADQQDLHHHGFERSGQRNQDRLPFGVRGNCEERQAHFDEQVPVAIEGLAMANSMGSHLSLN